MQVLQRLDRSSLATRAPSRATCARRCSTASATKSAAPRGAGRVEARRRQGHGRSLAARTGDRQETLERYEAALARLREDDREAIILRIELGCPYQGNRDGAGQTSVAAAHMAVSRALVRLAEEMSHERT